MLLWALVFVPLLCVSVAVVQAGWDGWSLCYLSRPSAIVIERLGKKMTVMTKRSGAQREIDVQCPVTLLAFLNTQRSH